MKKRIMLIITGCLIIFCLTPLAVFTEESLVSLDFNDTDINIVLKILSQKTGLNLILKENINGKINVHINQMQPMQALESILEANGYDYQQKEGYIYITKKKEESSLDMKTFTLKYVNVEDMEKLLKNVLTAEDNEKISISAKLNSLTIKATVKKLRELSELIKKIDIAPYQVEVEAKIIELKSGFGDNNNPSSIGVNWKYNHEGTQENVVQQLTSEKLNSAATSLGLYAQMVKGDLNSYLSAIQKTTDYNLIASPRITAINHEEAEILIGSKYGYKTILTTTTGTLEQIEFLEVGTKLTFIPHINDEGYIRMSIYPSISEGSVINNLPQENTTETKNQVLVKDGETIIIGGLIKNYENQVETGVPFLSDIPFLGTAFKKTEIINEKREILVLITPHIITPDIIKQMQEKIKIQEQLLKEASEKVNLVK